MLTADDIGSVGMVGALAAIAEPVEPVAPRLSWPEFVAYDGPRRHIARAWLLRLACCLGCCLHV